MGRYTSRDMIEWKYEGVSLSGSARFDCHGVYLGSAFVEDSGKMYLYYTMQKLEDGEFDYIPEPARGGAKHSSGVVSETESIFGEKTDEKQ